VKNIKGEPTAAEMPKFVTEHIVEVNPSLPGRLDLYSLQRLQSIGLFMKSITKTHPQLIAFFRTRWKKRIDATQVSNRRFKPTYFTARMTPRTSINDLVFETLGSNNNLKDLVMCESQINTFETTTHRCRTGYIQGPSQGLSMVWCLRINT
jgi:hypothetical protein